MIVLNNKNIDNLIMQVIDENKLKKINNNLYLSNKQIEVLNRYNINYNNYTNINDLIFEIESILNEGLGLDDLESISIELSEFNYYHNTNK